MWRHRTAHVRALSLISALKGLAFYDISDEKMRLLSQISSLPVTFCANLQQLAARSDGFIICTPNNLHVSLAEEVLKYKLIPFICEKPLSNDLISAKRLARIAPLRSIVSFNYRYNPIINKIQEVRKIAALGELNFFSAEFNKNSALTRKHRTWRDSARQNKSSGALGDLSCHLLDLFCLMAADKIRTGELRVVKGTRVGMKSDGPVEVDDNGYVFGRSVGGAFFRIQASKADETNHSGLHLSLIFDQGEIRYSTKNENRIGLNFFNKAGVQEIIFDDEKLLAAPPRELPYWSDSFYYLLHDWCLLLQSKRMRLYTGTITRTFCPVITSLMPHPIIFKFFSSADFFAAI